jgi:hypothetical protein
MIVVVVFFMVGLVIEMLVTKLAVVVARALDIMGFESMPARVVQTAVMADVVVIGCLQVVRV